MDWKELFKPTKVKIIATIIIALVELYSLLNCYRLDATPCGSLSFIAPILIIISIPIAIILEPLGDVLGNYSDLLMLIIGLLFSLIFAYIAVCAISWIINKLRKRNNKQKK